VETTPLTEREVGVRALFLKVQSLGRHLQENYENWRDRPAYNAFKRARVSLGQAMAALRAEDPEAAARLETEFRTYLEKNS